MNDAATNQAIESLGGLVCTGLLVCVMAIVIGACLFRTSCDIFNSLVGGDSVPIPSFGTCVAIHMLAGMGAGFLGGLISAAQQATVIAGTATPATYFSLLLANVAIAVLIMAWVVSFILPTSYGKAVCVSILNQVISVAFLAGIVLALVYGAPLLEPW